MQDNITHPKIFFYVLEILLFKFFSFIIIAYTFRLYYGGNSDN